MNLAACYSNEWMLEAVNMCDESKKECEGKKTNRRRYVDRDASSL